MGANETCMREPYNISSEEQPSSSAIIIKGVFLTIAVTISLVFNTLCIVVLTRVRDRSLNHVTKIFLISFTLCDIVGILFVYIPMTISTFLDIPLQGKLCIINGLSGTIFAYTSGIQLLAINLERYLAITYPLTWYNVYVTPKRAKIAVAVLWISAFGLSVFAYLLPARTTIYSPHLALCTSNPCGHGPDISGTILSSVFAFLPHVLTLILWLKIYLVARRHTGAIIAQAKSVNYSTPALERRYSSVKTDTVDSPVDSPERKISQSKSPVQKEVNRRISRVSLASIFTLSGTLDRRKSSKCSQAELVATNANRRAFFTFFLISICMAVISIPFSTVIYYDNIRREMMSYEFIAVAEILIVSFGFLNVIIYYARNKAFRKTAIKLFTVSSDPLYARPSIAHATNTRSTCSLNRINEL